MMYVLESVEPGGRCARHHGGAPPEEDPDTRAELQYEDPLKECFLSAIIVHWKSNLKEILEVFPQDLCRFSTNNLGSCVTTRRD